MNPIAVVAAYATLLLPALVKTLLSRFSSAFKAEPELSKIVFASVIISALLNQLLDKKEN